MTILQSILKILGAVFSPEFEVIIEEIQKSRRRDLSRRLEAAKEAAQSKQNPSTRELQKVAGELSE